MVQYFWEEHGGVQQRVILRVLSRHIKALERQIEESVLIERTSKIEKECMNLMSEWAGTKIPGLKISNPKSTGSNKEGGEIEDREGTDIAEGREIFEEALRRGIKRLSYRISQKSDIYLKYRKKREYRKVWVWERERQLREKQRVLQNGKGCLVS